MKLSIYFIQMLASAMFEKFCQWLSTSVKLFCLDVLLLCHECMFTREQTGCILKTGCQLTGWTTLVLAFHLCSLLISLLLLYQQKGHSHMILLLRV